MSSSLLIIWKEPMRWCAFLDIFKPASHLRIGPRVFCRRDGAVRTDGLQRINRGTPMNRKIILVLAGFSLAPAAAFGEEQPIGIGIMNDMSGPYSDYQGPGSVVAAQMAVEDYGGKAAGRKVEVISGDHQNKPDLGSALARQWIDAKGVNMI